MPNVAIVVARYGETVLGGAERHARGLAETLAQRDGWSVTVLTSCSEDQTTWRDELPVGRSELNGVVVRRFATSPLNRQVRADFLEMIAVDRSLTRKEQYDWLDNGEQCAELYAWLAANSAEFDLIFTLPYLSTVAFYAAMIAPEKTVIWPCLHNERYAYFEPYRLLIETVRGVLFISPEEQTLALEEVAMRPQQHAVVGAGVDFVPSVASAPPVADPYILYMGRLSEHKHLPLLYKYMQRYYDEGGRVRLALIGRGNCPPPAHPAFVQHGFVSETEKAELVAGALAVVQPSLMESFSLVIMEAWLTGKPVIVNGHAPVPVGHVQRAKGGLSFTMLADLREAIALLEAQPELAEQMGKNGRAYVEANYRWPIVLERVLLTVAGWGLV